MFQVGLAIVTIWAMGCTAKIKLADLDITEDQWKESSVQFSDLIKLENENRLNDFEGMELPFLIGNFKDKSPAAHRLESLATKMRDAAIFVLPGEELAESFGIAENDLVYVSRLKDSKVQYEGTLTEASLAKFISEQVPVIDEVRPMNFEMLMKDGKHLIWILTTPEEKSTHVKTLTPLATSLKDKYNMGWFDMDKWGHMVSDYGMPTTDLPRVVLEQLPARENSKTGGAKYWMDKGEVTAEAVKNLVTSFESGSLHPNRPGDYPHDHAHEHEEL